MRAVDRAGNAEPLKTPTTFYFDISTPTTKVELPVHGDNLTALPTIYFSASDHLLSLNSIDRVEYAIVSSTGRWYRKYSAAGNGRLQFPDFLLLPWAITTMSDFSFSYATGIPLAKRPRLHRNCKGY